MKSSFAAITMVTAILCSAGAETSAPPLSIRPHASCALQAGQLIDFWIYHSDKPIGRQWMTQGLLNMGVEAIIDDHLMIKGAVEGKMWFNTYPQSLIFGATNLNIPTKFFTWYFDRAEGIWSFGSPDRPGLCAEIGYFPYKYNADARNLGEYLFRSGTYPGYLVTEFDYPQARLAGLRIGVSLLHNTMRHDIILYSETDFKPFGDGTLAWVGEYAPLRFLTIGAGASLSHIIPVDKGLVTPHNVNNRYFTSGGDTAYYTFKGVKAMARAALDPKRIFLHDNTWIFGENDLRVYAEAAVLGLRNYPADSLTNPYGYDTLLRKMPVMFGMNLPCFKVLDLCAIELEWYGARYPDGYQKTAEFSLPLPDDVRATRDPRDYRRDDWKWSVYAVRSFGPHCSIIFQAARDHIRALSAYPENADRQEVLSTKGQWYWMGKSCFSF